MERPTPPARGRGAGRKAWRAHPCHQRRPCHGRAVVPGAGGKIYTCGASASPLQCSPSTAGQFYELTLSNRPGDFDDSETVLFREIARVIDGQHRIETCHDIAILLDREQKSPFFRRINRLGTATEGRSAETLSQASFVKALLPYISDNPLLDRDIGKRRGFWPKSQTFDRERLIFRDFFLAQEDEKIALNVWNYFDAVRQKWPAAWRDIEAGYISNRTNGFLALMRFLRPAFIALNGFGKVLPMQAYLTLFGPVGLRDVDFNRERYLPGSSGQTALYQDLMEGSGTSARLRR